VSTPGLWIVGPESVWVAEDHVLALQDYLVRVSAQCSQIADSLWRLQAPEADAWAAMDWGAVQHLSADVEGCANRARGIARALGDYAAECARQERARVVYFDVPRDSLIATVVVSIAGPEHPGSPPDWGVPRAAAALLGAEYSAQSAVVEKFQREGEPVSQASSLAERIRRIPGPEHPIRIEQYEAASGSVETEVFIAGTSEWSVGTTDNPFDLEGNLALVAGIPATSYMAVDMALRRSGVRPGDRVRFIGHSQGGLIATRMAESGRYTTTGLLTVGAPLGGASVRGDYPAVHFAHTDDVVPELGGASAPTKSVGIHRHSGAGAGDLVGAHSLEAYESTAMAADASPARDYFGAWSGGDTTTRPDFYRAHRAGGG
jgi:hypothetical protein